MTDSNQDSYQKHRSEMLRDAAYAIMKCDNEVYPDAERLTFLAAHRFAKAALEVFESPHEEQR